jgi:hypothetical protein
MDAYSPKVFTPVMESNEYDYSPEFCLSLPQVILLLIWVCNVEERTPNGLFERTMSRPFFLILLWKCAVGETAEGADAKFTNVEVGQKRPNHQTNGWNGCMKF